MSKLPSGWRVAGTTIPFGRLTYCVSAGALGAANHCWRWKRPRDRPAPPLPDGEHEPPEHWASASGAARSKASRAKRSMGNPFDWRGAGNAPAPRGTSSRRGRLRGAEPERGNQRLDHGNELRPGNSSGFERPDVGIGYARA